MLAANCAPICVSKPGKLLRYDWTVEEVPIGFYAHDEGLAPEDFVRIAVVRQPNLLLSDIEPESREGLERSLLLERRRELETPLEHVMAVMLDVGRDWRGGFMLYRDRRNPFSDRDRALLQRVTPALAKSVRNCRKMGEEQGSRWMLESLLRKRGSECLVLEPSGTEIMCTRGAKKLLKTWFALSEQKTQELPRVLTERLEQLAGSLHTMQPGQDVLEAGGPAHKLKVTFIPVEVHANRRLWALLLQESPHIPPAWREKLTKRELEVVARLLQGWDNKTIAEDLRCSVDTVKKHLQHIFDKLGVDQRSQVLHMAAQL
jgi:DNA-binding CsgD family transcriptional regulator